MQLLDGKKTAASIKDEIKQTVDAIKLQKKRVPHLAAILVGDSTASKTYINNKIKSCKEVGFKSTLLHLEKDITENELIAQINNLNNDNSIDGFIVQLPLPKHINEERVLLSITPEKDVDGFHPINLGKMMIGLPAFISATPKGIVEILKRYHIQTSGKHCVVVGRSNIVGTPISILLGKKSEAGNATVTLCHSHTKDLKTYTLQADIIIAATGKPNLITADMVKDGVVIIDVGINRIDDNSERGYHLVGDVDFKNVSKKSSYITPVPGGVGLMTVASLLQNTLAAYQAAYYPKDFIEENLL
ncbi:MAG TPA: bifunctional methylenetetrahydrofolate dehydrogenase/methenyltetrahydrofolate cyclohydrolase FolD [Chitinophagales bacterium]|nr:bifunctional methylenetetrahydrofolate dehydrogenase/methenyltetrahydrofolate cyclohydrolase FolD [Chitinophagales bacterium]HNJ59537.1 bifunctional methylenetetrahydrofolate dehydrogenase/methenyltetrahydrofolate cyclohydrolase FolD [Chitinophagales bacterium]